MGCEAMLKFAAMLTVSHVLEAPVFVPTADTTILSTAAATTRLWCPHRAPRASTIRDIDRGDFII